MKKRTLLVHEKDFYARNLPHWQPEHAVLFITTRLYGSLPKSKILELKQKQTIEEKVLKEKGLSGEALKEALSLSYDLYFGKFDKLLNGSTTGPHWLEEEKIAKIWTKALFHFDGVRYKVICSTVMSNHVHFIFYKLDRSLSRIMQSMKGYSAREINKVLQQTGQHVWQEESFDRMIRNRRELKYKINYVLNNAVEAGLVTHWRDWQYNYIHPDFLKYVD